MTTSEAGKGISGAIEADDDPVETREWLESIDAILRHRGPERALFLLQKLETQLRDQGVSALQPPYSAYRNTIPLEKQGAYPGDLAIEERLTSIIRWNALAMVVRANRAYGELGGHHRELRLGGGNLRDRLQPLLPRRGRRLRRRSRLFPAAFRARRLCARLPRRAPERGAARALSPGGRRRRALAPIRIPG